MLNGMLNQQEKQITRSRSADFPRIPTKEQQDY
jgi:hypothetical protein